MRLTVVLVGIACVLASCELAAPRPSAPPTVMEAPCAPQIVSGAALDVRLTTLDAPIGGLVVFGLDGAFVGTAFGYPLGAIRHWSLRDETGRVTGAVEWDLGSRPLVSPDGSRVAYITAALPRRLAVLDVTGGAPRPLSAIDRPPYMWLDDDHVLVDPPEERGVVHSIDVRDGSDTIVFRPFTPPAPNPAGPDWDGWELSGDLRWAILTRVDQQGIVTDQWLYDTRTGRAVDSLGPGDWDLAPRGDIAVSVDGGKIRVMHLCDQRIVELVSRSGTTIRGGGSWSTDGRYFSASFGGTSDDTGPESVVIVEPLAGRVGIMNGPWGFIHAWSPERRSVAVARRGYHDLVSRLAQLEVR